MSHSNLQNKQTLFEIAASQYGLFTAKQAIKAGFKKNNHPYHVQVGNWVREWHGIYRLARFPLMLLNKSLFHKELSLTVLLVTFNESTIPRRVGSVFLLPTITQLLTLHHSYDSICFLSIFQLTFYSPTFRKSIKTSLLSNFFPFSIKIL